MAHTDPIFNRNEHTVRITLAPNVTAGELIYELRKVPERAGVDVHVERSYPNPTDPGGRKTLILTWTTP